MQNAPILNNMTERNDARNNARNDSNPQSRQFSHQSDATHANRASRATLLATSAATALFGVLWIISAGLRLGWGNPRFWDWVQTSVAYFVMAVLFAMVALVGHGRFIPQRIEDERGRLIRLKAGMLTSRILYMTICIAEVLLFIVSWLFDSTPALYIGVGLLAALILHVIIAAIAQDYYEKRL
jgi:uncharacterized membrane protein